VLRLELHSAAGAHTELVLRGESFVLGRSRESDVFIPDRALSRRHARLFLRDGRWFLEDLGSRNGTEINGTLIGPDLVQVESGDVIGVGGSTVTFRGEGTAPAGSSPPSTSGVPVFRPARQLLEDSLPGPRFTAPADVESLRQVAHRFAMLHEVHQVLARSIELEELLELILDRAFEHLGPGEGAVFLLEEDGSFRCAARRPAGDDHIDGLCSHSLIEQVVHGGQAALVLDVQEDERFKDAASLMVAGLRSLVAAPLMEPGGTHGMIVLGSRMQTRQFDEEDMELLVSLAAVAAMRIRNVKLTQEVIARKRLERDIELARRIQVALLPDHLPRLPGYTLHAGNVPSLGVSGDFYKVVERAEGREVVLMVVDVSGKGISASLLTGSLEALSAAPIAGGEPPERVCASCSQLLQERTPPERYATMFLGVLQPGSGVVRYCNAGHTPGLWIGSDGTTGWLHSTAPPVGLVPGMAFEAAEVVLDPGDTLLVYTDGITEAENADGAEFGEDRLRELCASMAGAPPGELARAIETRLGSHCGGAPPLDDRTLLIVHRNSHGPG